MKDENIIRMPSNNYHQFERLILRRGKENIYGQKRTGKSDISANKNFNGRCKNMAIIVLTIVINHMKDEFG